MPQPFERTSLAKRRSAERVVLVAGGIPMRALFFAVVLLPFANGCSLALDLDQFLGGDAGGQADAGEQSDGGMEPCVPPPGSTGCPVQMAAGADFTCARFQTGEVSCWGNDARGQLGDGDPQDGSRPTPGPLVRDLPDAIDLTANGNQACAVRGEGGRVVCWGEIHVRAEHSPVVVEDISDAVQVSAGLSHRCALTSNAAVHCWGSNIFGQVGTGNPEDSAPPPAEVALPSVEQVSAGYEHTCARTASGRVYCWGANHYGQLGLDGLEFSRTPLMVAEIDDAEDISAGSYHTCALRRRGGVLCWGANDNGQLGRGRETTSPSSPRPVVNLSDAVEVHAGSAHTCARRENGDVVCWGANDRGQLGVGAAVPDATTPTKVSNVDGARSLEAGENHNCALLGNEAVCWGANESGQLGDGSTSTRYRPFEKVRF